MTSVVTASRHDPALREAAQQALGAPVSGLFDVVLGRAHDRGSLPEGLDLKTLAQLWPARAYPLVAAPGWLVTEDDIPGRRATKAASV